jgi:serine/threonine protein kinase/tetratricopeptide (TPR) repeat protein
MELLPGASLGPYKILEEIGSGHMGKVYLAQDERLDRRVALKTLTGSTGAEAERRLRKEARAIARLNNPNIAALYDVCEYDGVSLLVMEYADGESLSDLVTAEIGVDRTIDIGLQLTDALAYAHREGIIHRDVKPANVKLTRDGKVKLLDLGIARVSLSDPGATTSNMADTTAAAGTPAYMAPERLHGHPADTRTDVYSVGVLLFELLTGGRPYASTDMLALRVALGGSRTPRARAINPKVSRTLDDVVAKAMSRDPKTRYSSAADLHNDLLRARDSSSRRVVPIVRPQSRLGWTVVLGLAAIVAAIVWVVMRPPVLAPVLPTLSLLPIVNESTGQPDLDELGVLLQSSIARNIASFPGVRLVASNDEARGSQRSPDYTTSVTLRPTLTGIAAQVELRQGTTTLSTDSPEGDAVTVLREVADQLAGALEKHFGSGRGPSPTDAARAAYRYTPTKDGQALTSYLTARLLLDTSRNETADDKAASAFQDAVNRDKSFAFAYAGLSQAYSSHYNHLTDSAFLNRSEDAATQALKLDPKVDQAHIAMALVHKYRSKGTDAVTEARSAVALTPDSDDAYRTLGIVLVDKTRRDSGIPELSLATKLRPTHWINYYHLARNLLQFNRFKEAIEPFTKVKENVPDYESAWVNLGYAYMSLGEEDKAIGHLEHALTLNKTDHFALNNLATAFYWDKQYQRAVETYLEAIHENSKNSKLFMNLGDAHEALHHRGPAQEAYRTCVKLADDNKPELAADLASVLAIAAKCQAKLGYLEDATDRALKAQALKTRDDPDVLYKLAVVYALAGRPAKALDELARAAALGSSPFFIENDPDFTSLRNDPGFQALIAPPRGR